ncbi:MAG: hypothetical protein M4D80_32770 [Myxococcota bacterium]|nr:hypothetical protein [Deltaproteobacteria bacterium]MDQ3339959.1 hypothetical protein [Myxococcota bacterium]
MRSLLFVFLIACSSSSKPEPAPSQPAPAPAPSGGVMTKEECEAQGARVNASIGGGTQAHCADDETEIGNVRLGIEGGWCCKKK